MKSRSKGIIVDEEMVGTRLDLALATYFPDVARHQWQKNIADELVLVNGDSAATKYQLKLGDALTVIEVEHETKDFTVPVLYKDDDVLVINKPSGLLVHAKDGRDLEQTVVNIFKDELQNGDSNRPGVVHRLDRDTSGVMILARNDKTRIYLAKQFENRSVRKVYIALVDGVPKQHEAIIRLPIERNPKKPATFRVGSNGKPAETHYRVLKENGVQSLIELIPKTGRTHQLRVHMAHLGHPIVGDGFYNGSSAVRLMLHAEVLEISIAHDQRKTFIADIPESFTL